MRAEATFALASAGAPSAPLIKPLIGYLVHDSGNVRIQAYDALVKVGTPAMKPLFELLADTTYSWQVSQIIRLLNDIGPPVPAEAVPAVKALLGHPNPEVNHFASIVMKHVQ